MDTHCEKCRAQYELDDARIPEAGVPMRCTRCGHVFTVKKAVGVRSSSSPRPPLVPPASGSSASPSAPTVVDEREWKIRQASGEIVTFRGLRTLHKWILERKVTRDDEISPTGKMWKRLGQITELASFFTLLGEAPKANQVPMQASASGISPIGVIPSIAPVRAATPPASVPAAPSNGAVHGAIPAIAPMRIVPLPAPRAPEPPRPTAPEPGPPSQTISDITPELQFDEPSEVDERFSEQPPSLLRQRWRVVFFACTTLAATAALAYLYFRKPGPMAAEEGGAPVAKAVAPQARPVKPSPVVAAAAPSGEGSVSAIADATASDKGSPSAAAEASPSDRGSGTPVAEAPAGENGSGATAAEAPVSDESDPANAAQTVRDERTASTGGMEKSAEAVRRAKKESRKARSSARRAETSGPKDFDWYMTEGDRLRNRQRPRAAIDAYTAAADRAPTRVDPIAGKGFAHLDLGQTQQAEAAFREALRLNPRYAVAVIGLAETYRKMGKNSQAIDQYQRYLQLLPNGSKARVARTAIERLKQ